MISKPFILILIILFFLTCHLSFSQNDSIHSANNLPENWKKGRQYLITLYDETSYTGEIISDDGREFLIDTKKIGKLYINKNKVKSIDVVTDENFSNGTIFPQNAYKHHYLAGTNLLPFKKGEIQVNSTYFFTFGGHYSINENFSIGLVTSIVGSPLGLSLKSSFKVSETSYLGAEINAFTMSYSRFKNIFGNAALKFTSGNSKTNYSIGLGSGFYSFVTPVGFLNNQIRVTDQAYYFSGGIFHRFIKNAALVGEGVLLPQGNVGIVGIGIRGLKKTHVSRVFGIYNLILYMKKPMLNNKPLVIPIPFFGATRKF